MSDKRVLSIGQCFADHGSITHTLRKHFQAAVEPADSAREALERLRQTKYDLVLVNRILDADHTSGLDVIRKIRADNDLAAIPVMLVSNYDDAQREATNLGALPGFGKSALGQPAMLARVRAVLEG